MNTVLTECAEWHETRAKLLRMSQQALAERGVVKHRDEEIAMHERFAVAIREADTDEPKEAS